MHIDAVIAQISTYSASISKPVSVVEFGVYSLPSAPYVVVRQESGFFRVTTHFLPGQESALRLYVRKDLSNALEDQTLNDSGSYFRVRVEPENVPDPIINTNDDGTISQERLFSVADRI